ncbi:T6SS effector amidase Tae4 family protein [Helicobacter sp. T3_23-1056]
MKNFSKCSKNGIVFMRIKGFSSAVGHTTLWNGDNFADNTNWLDGNVFIETFYFWQLS